MEAANNILTFILGLVSLGSTIISAAFYFHRQSMEEISELKEENKSLQRSITKIEKDMLKNSDSRVSVLLDSVNRRVQSIDQYHDGKHQEVKSELEEFKDKLDKTNAALSKIPPVTTATLPFTPGKIIDLDDPWVKAIRQLEKDVKWLMDREKKIVEVVRSQNVAIKELRSEVGKSEIRKTKG